MEFCGHHILNPRAFIVGTSSRKKWSFIYFYFFSYLATAEIVRNLLYSKGEKKITKSSVPYTYTSVGLSTAL